MTVGQPMEHHEAILEAVRAFYMARINQGMPAAEAYSETVMTLREPWLWDI